ncbi:LysR family transcriptional regulator [Paremcibacter congregatus]|uniref:LysR family transcriptional regulator n=1 Tax=Paremcibacter congregatus TaxID=2043170 RepID=UPI0030EC80DC|tara:strand:- start:3517 stop:4446 length:930 start_codon:yes stop_codon:yes gene_type:complete
MRYRQIEVFHAVMMYGTVTKAAQNLRVSQPSVTSSIQNTEAELGFSLFDRTGGRLTPTAEARILFDEVDRAHDSLLAVDSLCNRLKEGSAGHIRIAATPALSQRILPSAISRFQKQHQRFTFDISSEHSPAILSNLDERPQSFHLGFTFGVEENTGLRTKNLANIPIYCVVPKNLLANLKQIPALDEPLDLNLIADLPFIDLYENEPLGRAARSLLLSANVSPTGLLRVHDHHMAAALVHKGMGVTILDSLSVHNLCKSEEIPNIVAFKLPGSPTLPITAVFSQNRNLTYPIRHFIDCVISSLESSLEI